MSLQLGRAVAWSACGRWLQAGLAVVGMALIARLIGPEAYGAFAAALAALTLAEMVAGGALTEVLVQHENPTRGHLDAVFLLSVGVSALAWAGFWLAADPIARLFRSPELAHVLPVVGLVLPLRAVAAVPAALLQRDLRMGALATGDSASALTATGVGLGLAYAGAGVWAMVGMELSRTVVRAGVFAVAARWRPGLSGRVDHLRDTARFNAGLVVLKALQSVDKALPRALIGGVLGPAALGYFAMAWRLYDQVSAVLIDPISALATPVAARARNEPDTLRRLLTQAIDLSSALAYPAFLGIAATAPVLVPLVFGAGWAGAVPVVQVAMLMGLRSSVSAFNGGVLRGLGRPDLQVRIVALGASLTVVLAPSAAPFGAVAVAAALVLRGFATWPLSAFYVRRLTGLPMKAQFAAGGRSLVAAALMAATVSAFLHYGRHALSPVALLAAGSGLGALVYAAVLAAVAPNLSARVREALAARIGRGGLAARTSLPQ